MHREIQIKQFPIVTTHWWPKTRNERFVWENEQYLYRFLPLVHNHVQVIWVRTHIRCVTCVCVRSGSSASTLDGGRVWSVVLTQLFKRQRRRQPIRSPHANTQSRSCNTREVCDGCCNYDGASAPRFRHALFFPLIETVTYTCHYMTDRLERFDLKTSNWIYWRKKDTYILGCPWGKLIDTTF